MKVSLKDLTYIDDFDLFKIIISSADNFPGLYRFHSSWRSNLERGEHMTALSLFEAVCSGKQWSRNEWFDIHRGIFDLGFGENGRDSDRTDREVGELLKKKAINWLDRAKSLSLAVIDIYSPIEEIQLNRTYYVMGSLIRFSEKSVEISYNHYDKTSHTSLKVDFEKALSYVKKTFDNKMLSLLFVPAEIVARLEFKDSDIGHLGFNLEDAGELLLNFSGNSPVFASVDYDEILPIRFAKLIGVSNVCK